MSNIRDLIEQKNKLEDKFKTILTEFLYKYIIKIYKTLPDKRLKTFQKTLLYVPEWSESKREKVYEKFLGYLKNKSINDFDFEYILENIISLNIKIILIFSDNYKNEFVTIPEPSDFLFRCIKYTAKAYYDCPSQIEEPTSSQKLMIKEIIEWNIQKFIPLKKIFDYRDNSSDFGEDNEISSESTNDSIESSSEKEEEEPVTNLQVEKEEEIKYLPEKEINEYYQSESDDDNVDNIRHVTIKKKSKKF